MSKQTRLRSSASCDCKTMRVTSLGEASEFRHHQHILRGSYGGMHIRPSDLALKISVFRPSEPSASLFTHRLWVHPALRCYPSAALCRWRAGSNQTLTVNRCPPRLASHTRFPQPHRYPTVLSLLCVSDGRSPVKKGYRRRLSPMALGMDSGI